MGLKIVFMGTPEFAVETLDAIVAAGYKVAGVVTVPDRQVGRGQKVAFSAVKEYALAHNLRVLQPEKLRDEGFLEELRGIGADLFVVVAFRMLPKVVWAMPRMGTFNLHASLLPQYRGAAPINWAIINGEKETGLTTFRLNEQIDEGEILLQRKTAIGARETAGSLHDRLAAMGRELVVETIRGLESGELKGKAQETTGELKPAPKIFKEDCKIDWTKSGEEIENFVRGLSPYPAATTRVRTEKGEERQIKVYETEYEKGEKITKKTIENDAKKVLKIGCGDGFVRILSLQMEGKRRMTTEEFLRGTNVSNWEIAD
ncbi:MAG: methionyl-tRNA formyltransferase [Bacteroidales bacterium]|nr:methionyl-tRNA formyltransferase [Bacteroidales bacterium]